MEVIDVVVGVDSTRVSVRLICGRSGVGPGNVP